MSFQVNYEREKKKGRLKDHFFLQNLYSFLGIFSGKGINFPHEYSLKNPVSKFQLFRLSNTV